MKRRIGDKINIDYPVKITVIEADEEFVTLGFQARADDSSADLPVLLQPSPDKHDRLSVH